MHVLRGLEILLLDIDRAIRIIRETEAEVDVVPNLMRGFSIDEVQAEFIAEIKLRQLNRQYLLKRTKDIEQLEHDIQELKKLADSSKRQEQYIKKQLQDISKKYGKERLTQLVATEDVEQIDAEDLIEDYNLKVFLTSEGYLKKLALTSLRSAGDLKLKDDDRIVQEIETTNKSEIIFFSNQAQVYKMWLHDIPDNKPSEFGSYTVNLLELDEGERIIAIHVPDETYSGEFLLGFQNGKVARFPVSVYETKTNRRKLVNAYYDGSPIVSVTWLADGASCDVAALSDQERMIVFESNLISLKRTRTTQGNQALASRKGSKMIALSPVDEIKGFDDPSYYRVRKLPAAGRFLKEKELAVRQLSLDDLKENSE